MLKRITYAAALITLNLCAGAQVTPPAAYPAAAVAPVNYIRTWDATAPVNTEAALLALPLKDAKQATQYMDGLGRPLQTVVKQGSYATGGTATDIVSPVVYDNLGREQYKYLPFAANNTGGNSSLSDGLFKRNPFQQQAVFAAAQYPGETFFYSKTNFEASPLNKVTDSYAPGTSWAGSESNLTPSLRRSISKDEFANATADAVWIWDVTVVPGDFSTYSSSINYPAGQLMKTISKDEQGKQVIEYKDRRGQVILKKVQLDADADDGSGNGHDGWLCTYYLYDVYGNLNCVVPPKAVQTMLDAGNRTLTGPLVIVDILNELCFQYAYDGRNRMTLKKVPGAGPVSMVYDALDRPVLVQDANMLANGKWLYTKYDALSRPVSTGLWTTGDDRATLAAAAYSSTDYPTLSPGDYEPMTWTYYDENHFDAYTKNPQDDANFASNSTYPYPQPITQSHAVRGMVTKTTATVLAPGGPSYDEESNFICYDDFGRVLQTQNLNNERDITYVTSQYSYSGQLLQTVTRQEINTGTLQTHIVQTKMSYDDLGRLKETQKKINSNVNATAVSKDWQMIATNEYDAMGQLKNKKLAPAYNSNAGLETEQFDYNIRGWLRSMNKDYITGAADNYFGFELGYDKAATAITGTTFGTTAYNGNISGSLWRSKGDGEKRKFDYSYDAVNRLTGAAFSQYTGGAFNTDAGIDFSVSNLSYDPNGNIMTMSQKGLKINASDFIDDLVYTYMNGGNKLQAVVDDVNDNSSRLGDFKYDAGNKSDTDYGYDDNGNMMSDENKRMTSIVYNHLNLPERMTIKDKGIIEYYYDAAGTKLRKHTTDNSTSGKTITTDTYYRQGFIYESKHTDPVNDPDDDHDKVLQFFGHEEGRARFKPAAGAVPAGFVYDYMLKDHLGNVRMVLTEETQQDKYPVASLEPAKVETEKNYYSIVDAQIVKASTVTGLPTYTNDNGIGNNPSDATFEAANSNKLYKLNGDNPSTNMGLGITLKVMAGDKIDIFGKSYYFQNAPNFPPGNAVDISALLEGLLGGSGGAVTGSHGPVTATDIYTDEGTAGITALFDAQIETEDGVSIPRPPRAFINYIFFDEQFKCVGSGFSKVGPLNVLKDHHSELQNLEVPKNGFVYIYCSNESRVNVFFDNLQVVHTRSPILEETHYYPFGLTMAGISSKAAGGMENKNKFNKGSELQNHEFSDGSGLELYETPLRSLDPQLGRWWQIDSKPDYSQSVYSSMGNNPILYNDALGDSIIPVVSYDYSRTPTPTRLSDLGNTTDTNIGITSATVSNINIQVDISISLSAAFKGTTRSTNIETQNPGLEKEVKAHEEGHKDQIIAAANQAVTVTININGEPVKFTGTADNVIVNATKAFNSSTESSNMNADQRQTFVNTSISTAALTEMGNNIDKVYKASDKETDANKRAAATLGADTIKYSNFSTPINFNCLIIRE